jgi:hypothetical protein
MDYIPPPEPQAPYKYTMELSVDERLDLIQVIRVARQIGNLPTCQYLTATDFLYSLGVKP